MATSQIETVSTGADKAKLAIAAVLAVGAIVAFYALGKQGALVQWGALLVGLMTNYVGFLLPTLTQFASIFLMVAVLMWRPQGVYPVANR